jgi:hypothetical protein
MHAMGERVDAKTVAAMAALLDMELPPGRAAAIATELARLARRVASAQVQPAIEDEPGDFARAQQ